ncbi:hypothetical protein A2Y85_07080 [candidate division WOR-3 bacterium RBG_13_43_14]|uniref:C_GCAxxG_C_C family protein n=1 Tax=candidate division WOR-3 bacterium RBG_13_43_14 TaxID=1802590 RepID=A0A1F4U8D8_UNCW3|nr:MAG: hypothetical protein A2Y85_07080 [candidate division WOR-3 bacterium RBG_13_43_14]
MKSKRALKFFDQGFNCSQSIFSAFAPAIGLTRVKALRIASAFGGGICRRGELCGAITGSIMAIGLKYGRGRANDEAAKEKTYRLAQKLMRWFERRYGTMLCGKLIKVDIRKNKKIWSRFHPEICRELVKATALHLDHLL